MAKNNVMEWAYFDAYKQEDFEFGLKRRDAMTCSHMGRCDEDCENTRHLPYIREQLGELTDAQMKAAVSVYGVDFEEYKDNKVPREVLELYIVWLAAGNIMDDIHDRTRLAA